VRTWAPSLTLLGLCAVFAVASPRFLTQANLQTLVDQAAIPLVLAVGLTFVVLMGSIDLSLQGVMAVSSIAVSLLVANDFNGTDLGIVGVLAAVGLGAALGLLNGVLYVALRVPSLMVTIGTWFVALGVAALLFPGRQARLAEGGLIELAQHRPLGFAAMDFLAVAVLLIAFGLQRYTTFGRGVYAIGGGEEVARLSGLRVDRIKVLAFTVAGLTAGLAGVMATARLGVGSVDAGADQLFPAIAAVVVGGTLLTGGRGGVLHTLVGVLLLTVLVNGLVLVGVDPYIRRAVEGGVVVAAVIAGTWPLRSRLRVVK